MTIGYISCLLALIYRVDVAFSPLVLVLLFANFHCATFAWHRTITGAFFIVGNALVWIYDLDFEVGFFLKTQTLTYIHTKYKSSPFFIFYAFRQV